MNTLTIIEGTVQNIAEAISSVLEMDVTIMDSSLMRVAGTGHFRNRHEVPANSVFVKSLQSGKSFVITEPKQDPSCRECANRSNCEEKAEVCCPIILDNKVIGVIGIVTFDEDKKLTLINKKRCYLNFLEKMSGMVALKVSEEQIVTDLRNTKKELELAFNIVDLGLLSINAQGKVSMFNRQAEQLLHAKNNLKKVDNFDFVFPEFEVEKALKTGLGYKGRNLSFYRNDRRYDLIASADPITIDGRCLSVVLSLQDKLNLKRSIHKVFQGNQEYTFSDLTGQDPSFLSVIDHAKKAAYSDSTILITGESGTGKELMARAIHEESKRNANLFVTVNCAAIPEQLLESELFGYEEGAFTGSRKGGKLGLFELASGGTIFLDEIGDMPIYLQAKLLRVLQDKKIKRVGGLEVVDLNIRIISATNKDLSSLIDAGLFREDLYYRLNVIPLNLPPLRGRKSDITLLAEMFVNKYNQLSQKSIEGLSPEASRILCDYAWPGNVRELENVIEYAVNIEKEAHISVDTLKARLNVHALEVDQNLSLREMMDSYEKNLLKKMLQEYGNSFEAKKRLARDLKISKSTLYRKLDKL